MRVETGRKKWWEVYDVLAKALIEEAARLSTVPRVGRYLFDLLIRNEEFVANNKWIRNFQESKFGVESLDPFHLFASLNSGKASDESRYLRIKILFNALGLEFPYNSIDFTGCPTPSIVKIISIRKESVQVDIWNFFIRIYRNGIEGLRAEDFEELKYWYGIEISSFTIFLFWIRSDCFLPLDRGTKGFISTSKIVQNAPRTYESYQHLLVDIARRNINYPTDHYGDFGLCREITHIAYQLIVKGEAVRFWSQNLQSLTRMSLMELNEKYLTESTDPGYYSDETETKSKAKGLRIIAIKAIENCAEEHLGILKQNVLYQIDNSVSFEAGNIQINGFDPNLYYDKNNEVGVTINISAIVGANGSGKSTLSELLFRVINNISCKFKGKLHTSELKWLSGLNVELYYVLNSDLYQIILIEQEIRLAIYTPHKGIYARPTKRKFRYSDFNALFYTIAENYSQYGLNSRVLGEWIKELFHKNDSYQAPIVINPLRTNGNIDVNIQFDLLKYRLITNIFSKVDDAEILRDSFNIRNLTDKQRATSVHFLINEKKSEYLYKQYYPYEDNVSFDSLTLSIDEVLEVVDRCFKMQLDKVRPLVKTREEKSVVMQTEKYIVSKLVRICRTYVQYNSYFDEKACSFTNLDKYCQALLLDNSHVTYKLRQAINFIKYYGLFPKKKNLEFPLDAVSYDINGYISKNAERHPELSSIDTLYLIPPPIYNPVINLIDKNGKPSKFERLSSGEQQKIRLVNSILYHLRNVDSIDGENDELTKYKNVFLLMDEVELYQHPEMQRTFISYLINSIHQAELQTIESIYFSFITHSPFILSDIPKKNILFLDEEGWPAKTIDVKTFGANIHELLIDAFFMKQTLGDISLNKVKDIVQFYQKVVNSSRNDIQTLRNDYISKREEYIFIRDNIGEKYIASTLSNHIKFIEEHLNIVADVKN